MLTERIFAIGGWLTIAAGALLLIAFVLNPVLLLTGVVVAGILLLGFGGFFLYVGRGAHRERQRLLETPKPPP
jgi:Flp pilus assembly protein TadB